MHKEELDISWVLDEESLVSGWGQMAGLAVGAITNLYNPSAPSSLSFGRFASFEFVVFSLSQSRQKILVITNRWHSKLSLEPSSDTVINTLWLSP